MTQHAMLKAVQSQSEEGEFDEIDGAFDDFDGRVEDLHWREDTEGILYAAESRSQPEVIVRVELTGDGVLSATQVTPEDLPQTWRRLSTVSSPDSGVQDRQYD